MFVDEVEIQVEAGSGGNGCISFRREKYVANGGPDGGDGGDGGSVVITADDQGDNLYAVSHKKHWKAPKGNPGEGSQRHGRNAADIVIHVPAGTIIIDAEHDFVLKDLVERGESFVVARGGKGGKGNERFKSSTNRAPRQSTPGGDGEKRRIRLELKVIADVGLVGKPNAGKSTLLSRISRAKPKIASYPFTTKTPNLGQVQIDFDHAFMMADIPGLIEGAHDGIGLGHEFLRHIQRAGILVHLVEPEPTDGTDPLENYRSIRDELVQYDAELGERPEILVVTKADLPVAEEVRELMSEEFDKEILLISAVTGQGLNELVGRIAQQLNPPSDW